jgi:hypothetical protein
METCNNIDPNDKLLSSTNHAIRNFENMKKCIEGLFEILNITLSSDNIYFKMGEDNIEALYGNFLELMFNILGTNELMKKLQNSEINLDIPSDNP